MYYVGNYNYMNISNLLFTNIPNISESVIPSSTQGGAITVSRMPRRIILKNGLRIVYETSPNTLPLTSIQCFVRLGSINETNDIRGISHMIEHMMFKGTRNLPTSTDVSNYYDENGAYINAYTDKQLTCYVIKCQNDYFQICLQILADMLFNSKIEHKNFNTEYQVVVEETRNDVDDISTITSDSIDKMLYKGSSFETPVDHLSYHKKIMNYNKVVEIYKNYYIPQNMVLSIVSPLPFKKILHYIKNTFFFKTKKIYQDNFLLPSPNFCIKPSRDIQIIIQQKMIESTNIAIGFRTCSMYSNDKYILKLLKNVLIGPETSRFFNILRNKNGLTYNTNININNYETSGDFTIFTQIDPNKLIKNGTHKGLLPIISSILQDLYINGITEKELNKSKGFLKGRLARNIEDNNILAEHNGKSFLFDNEEQQENVFSYLKKYELHYSHITCEDIHRIIKKYFINENLCIFIIGYKNPTIKTIRDLFMKF